jgi:hypothetical protein
LFAAVAASLAVAQTLSGSRITQAIDDQQRVTLKGNVHPLAQARFDQGVVADSFPAERMLMLLQRSPEQEAALRQFLQDVHTPGNPSYHKWLAPEEFGKAYGPSDADVAGVSAWLESHGFSVAAAGKGKTAIEFSGNAGQVREAFHTEIHTYRIKGVEHHANDRDPQIPAALAAVVAGITPMNDFRPKSNAEVLGQAVYDVRTHQVTPEWTTYGLPTPSLAVAPGDFAVQYDLNPVYSAGTNGAGVTIGIIGDSNVNPTMVAAYRTLFGLPAGTLKVIVDGNDPGINGAVIESYLDVELSGAVAPGATINLYTSAGTNVQDGLYLEAMRAVGDNQAAVLSTSYGECEQDLGAAGNQFWAAIWEQAAAQGQTAMVSSGDGGSAGCDDFDDSAPAQYGLAVSGFASTPWNIAVGGTDFYYSNYGGTSAVQNAQLANYWNLTSSSQPVTSLLSPIPEQPWNNAFGLNLYTAGVYNPSKFGVTIVGGSGGASSCSSGTSAADGTYSSCGGGYAKPAWQSGTGVPTDGVRDIPDVSLYAANGMNDSFYPICAAVDATSDVCTADNSGLVNIYGVGGTSASSPAMAGILALVNQKYGRQGQANFTLYPLAAQHPAVFHDVTVGSNNVPCVQGSPNCALSTLKDNTNGFYTLGKYYAGVGYDEATGLGSVDASLLLQYWNSLSFAATSTTLSLDQTTFTHGTPVNVSVGVSGNGGTPTGDVALISTATPTVNTGVGELTLQNGAATSSIDSLPGGQYKLTARYAGDSTFASSTSPAVALDVTPEASVTSISGLDYNYSTQVLGTISSGGTYPYGLYMAFDAQATGAHAPAGSTDGIATGTMVITDSASTGTIGSGTMNLGSNSVVHWWPSSGLPAGNHSVVASYSGDSSFNPSSSAPFTFTITKVSPYSMARANPPVIAINGTASLTVAFGVPTYAPPPTGAVTFTSGTTVLGTAQLVSCMSSTAEEDSYPCDIVGGGYSGASVNVSGLPMGTTTVTAAYGGDANFNPVTSSTFTVTVENPAGLTATANPTSINQLQWTAVTATVTGVSGVAAPTGFVFYDAVGPYGTWTGGENLVNGSAVMNFAGNGFQPGTVSVQVTYEGDANYAPTEVTVPFVITVPFTVAGAPFEIATPGATTGNTSTVTITPVNGFTGSVSLSCVLTTSPAGAQHLPSCGITPTVAITGTTAATATMTITSTGATTSGALSLPPINRMRWLGVNGAVTLAGLILLGIPARGRRRRFLLGLVFVLVVGGCFSGCGGGGGSVITIPGTTAGDYTFTVTGTSQGISINGTVIVTIQ